MSSKSMAYSQSKKQTDAEKRLQAIRLQLYGKEEKEVAKSSTTFQFTSTNPKNSASSIDSGYLKRDLFKTMVLATFAITAQLLLYFSLNRGLIKF